MERSGMLLGMQVDCPADKADVRGECLSVIKTNSLRTMIR
jgi:hypothetical protein